MGTRRTTLSLPRIWKCLLLCVRNARGTDTPCAVSAQGPAISRSARTTRAGSAQGLASRRCNGRVIKRSHCGVVLRSPSPSHQTGGMGDVRRDVLHPTSSPTDRLLDPTVGGNRVACEHTSDEYFPRGHGVT